LSDGASKDILRWITHAPEGDVVDDYTTLVWVPLCREVAKLQISLPEREEVSLGPLAERRRPAREGGTLQTPRSVATRDLAELSGAKGDREGS
jgi:hypothetical protein